MPHSHALVTAAREEVDTVRMPANTVNVIVMASKPFQALDMVGAPQPRSTIVRSGGEIVAVRTPLDIPDGIIMSTVCDEAGPSVKGPEADGFISGGG